MYYEGTVSFRTAGEVYGFIEDSSDEEGWCVRAVFEEDERLYVQSGMTKNTLEAYWAEPSAPGAVSTFRWQGRFYEFMDLVSTQRFNPRAPLRVKEYLVWKYRN
jgi:hypothetical protein